VKNPYQIPTYALPYGFVQSPILSTLVLMQSPVGDLLRNITATGSVTVTVYMDDISLSSDDEGNLVIAFEQVSDCLIGANFAISAHKIRNPSPKMDIFNCDLSQGKAQVQQGRKNEFFAEPHSPESIEGFDQYCLSVEEGNSP
jgi:hypothetical protein